MPKRMRQVTYQVLINFLRAKIVADFGSLTKFTQSAEFEACDFENTEKEKHKFLTYLSRSEVREQVKSVPTLKKLCKGLLGFVLESEVKVTRVTNIYIPENIKIDIIE